MVSPVIPSQPWTTRPFEIRSSETMAASHPGVTTNRLPATLVTIPIRRPAPSRTTPPACTPAGGSSVSKESRSGGLLLVEVSWTPSSLTVPQQVWAPWSSTQTRATNEPYPIAALDTKRAAVRVSGSCTRTTASPVPGSVPTSVRDELLAVDDDRNIVRFSDERGGHEDVALRAHDDADAARVAVENDRHRCRDPGCQLVKARLDSHQGRCCRRNGYVDGRRGLRSHRRVAVAVCHRRSRRP